MYLVLSFFFSIFLHYALLEQKKVIEHLQHFSPFLFNTSYLRSSWTREGCRPSSEMLQTCWTREEETPEATRCRQTVPWSSLEHVVFVNAVTLVQQITRLWSRRKSVRGGWSGCAHIWVTRIPLTQHWPWPTGLITTITLPDLTPRTFRGGRLEHFYFRSYKWKDLHFTGRTVIEHRGWRALSRDLVGSEFFTLRRLYNWQKVWWFVTGFVFKLW